MQLSGKIINSLERLLTFSGEQGNLPNAAVLVDSRTHKLLASAPSLVATNSDATAHAERLVISQQCQEVKKPVLHNTILITVMEPCLMCLSAAYWAGIQLVYFVIPASVLWDEIPWMAESKKIDKHQLLTKFHPPLKLKHLPEYEKHFSKITQPYLDKVIKRE